MHCLPGSKTHEPRCLAFLKMGYNKFRVHNKLHFVWVNPLISDTPKIIWGFSTLFPSRWL
jgi:hypothetical protein